MSQPTIPPPATAVVEFETVLKNVLHDDGTLQESLGHLGIHNIYDFLSLTLEEIDSLTKPQTPETSQPGVTTMSSATTQTTPLASI